MLNFLFILFPLSGLFALTSSNLTLEEKVGQILMVHFNGQEINEDAIQLIQDIHVGGIIYYKWANGLDCPQSILQLSQQLQNLAHQNCHPIPLFIAVDQEGGLVNRLTNGFTIFPGNYALGQTEQWQWGEESAWMMGKELHSVGINMNLAPVVDVFTRSTNPIIDIRAFDKNPFTVALWGEFSLKGYQKAGIIAVIKHFPGHGDVDIDSHEGLPILKKEREELERTEFLPFRILAPKADVIMTCHLQIPTLDAHHSVTFSKEIVQNLLRNDMQFHGVIMTDSLAMEGAMNHYASLEETTLQSFFAGHDLILLGGKQLNDSKKGLEFGVDDIKRVHQFLVDAVKNGILSEKRLNNAVDRILALKKKYQLFDFQPRSFLLSEEEMASHRSLARQIAKKALQTEKGESLLPLSLHNDPLLILAPECLREYFAQTSWIRMGENVKIVYFQGLNPDLNTFLSIREISKTKQSFFFAYQMWKNPAQEELFQMIKEKSQLTVAVVVRNPIDCEFVSSADIVLKTFSPAPCSLQAAFEYIFAN